MENETNGKLKAEVIQAVKNHPDLTYAEIAELFSVKPNQVGSWANQAGIRRQKSAIIPTQEDGELNGKILRLEQELAEARRLKAATEIRFERDGSKVAVFGVGAQPLVAEYKDWLRLLRNGWGAKLREFIQVQFGSVNGSSCIQ